MKLHRLDRLDSAPQEKTYGADRPGDRLLAVWQGGSWTVFCPLDEDLLETLGTRLMLSGYSVHILPDPDRWGARLEVAGAPNLLRVAAEVDCPLVVESGPLPRVVRR